MASSFLVFGGRDSSLPAEVSDHQDEERETTASRDRDSRQTGKNAYVKNTKIIRRNTLDLKSY